MSLNEGTTQCLGCCYMPSRISGLRFAFWPVPQHVCFLASYWHPTCSWPPAVAAFQAPGCTARTPECFQTMYCIFCSWHPAGGLCSWIWHWRDPRFQERNQIERGHTLKQGLEPIGSSQFKSENFCGIFILHSWVQRRKLTESWRPPLDKIFFLKEVLKYSCFLAFSYVVFQRFLVLKIC